MAQPSFLREDETRAKRWEHLTKGLEGTDQKVLETLLDNTQAIINEETNTGAIAVFSKIAKPLLRRIYQESVARELVATQPLTQPDGRVFYLDLKYGTAIAPTVAGDKPSIEGGRFNRLYTSGKPRGELLGTGNAANVAFQLKWFPIVATTLVVYVNSTPASATVNVNTGVVTMAAAPANAATVTADYDIAMEGLGSKGTAQIPEVELEMSSAPVSVESKKLKAKWTIEAQQDLQAYHELSAEDELVKFMGDEIRREIDRTIITDLYTKATAGNVNWDDTIPNGTKLGEHYETLVHAVNDASLEIFKKRRVHANFVVMGTDSLSKLDKVNSFRLAGFGREGMQPEAELSAGPNVRGTLANRYRVIVDPDFPVGKILVGYKGSTWFDTGYVYSPYRVFQTQTFVDPNDMIPRKGIMSRFARHLVNGDYYATVTVV